jgi:hypothetical protein
MSTFKLITHTKHFILYYIQILLLGPFVVILASSVLVLTFYYIIISNIYTYFKPDYATALINGFKRPIIGLHLCSKCNTLRRWPSSLRVRHYDDLKSLEASAAGDCWLCRVICAELRATIQHRDDPPDVTWREDIDHPKLILWFAERTETKSGFLDSMRGKGTTP